ncbi:sensory box histidine kinase [Clostridium sp. CAG:632]|nr:sensory box histidine kinase [Clostridium sp. CAG:632]
MKRKINAQYILLTICAILLTLSATTFVYYRAVRAEIMDSLKSYAHVLQGSIEQEVYGSEVTENARKDEIRITVIGEDGTVLYDSQVDSGELENHDDRPEVKAALLNGEGKCIRRSDTLNQSIFYYALRMQNGEILRVAKESRSVWNLLQETILPISILVVILIGISILLSNLLTRSIIKPIEELARHLDAPQKSSEYKELTPFVTTIQKQHEDIIKAARMRQDFTANVSHELKTPLTSISGYSELIENGMATEEDAKRFAGEIHKNAKRLLTLINDILRLSELDVSEENHVSVAYETVDLESVAKNCIHMLELNAQKQEVTVELDSEPCVIQANKQMMEELIYNLCDNAIRYNNRGGKVLVRVHEIDETGNVELVVKDNGIGIPKEHQDRIFERFYRVDKSRSKSTGGTGLGLAIVKHIVSQHRAEMTLESESGAGTTIRILFKEH